MNKSYKILEPRRLPTFGLPTLEDIQAIEVGDWVKLIFAPGERMWVQVSSKTLPHKWIGLLDNDPQETELIKGDEIIFNPRDVIDIITNPRAVRRE